MPAASKTLEAIVYERGSLKLIDQRRLPLETIYGAIKTVDDVWTAIREMRVRGAPAIAVSAALGIAVAAAGWLKENPQATTSSAVEFLMRSLDHVSTSRPTAVNLFHAIRELKSFLQNKCLNASSAAAVVENFTDRAEEMFHEDVAYNASIMKNGASHLTKLYPNDTKLNIVTICNTGALATARYGTALGVIRELAYTGHLGQVFALETRPWNQGARLTVYECVTESFPVTLLCDSAASSLMKCRKIHAAIVGADRVCANGDTANKIGTYNLAVAAQHHNVPFYVAAPTSTIDAGTACGGDVVVEERDPREMTHNPLTGDRVIADGPTLSVWNPVFDITPGELISAIITDVKVFEREKCAPFYQFV